MSLRRINVDALPQQRVARVIREPRIKPEAAKVSLEQRFFVRHRRPATSAKELAEEGLEERAHR